MLIGCAVPVSAAETELAAVEAQEEIAAVSAGLSDPACPDFLYTVNDDGTATVEYNAKGQHANVTVPSTIGGRQVTAVIDFKQDNKIKTVVLPDTVQTICKQAFYLCQKLESITLPEGLTTIGESAFEECSSLNGVTLPRSLTSVGKSAFASCSSLTEIEIPDSMTTLNNYLFSGCSKLSSVVIPDSVTEIGDSAFHYCRSLTQIDIPDSVTKIGGFAFLDAPLVDVVIPKSVESVDSNAFAGCSELKTVTFLNKDTDIHKFAFDAAILPEDKVTFYGYTGSTAEAYAAKKGFDFIALGSAVSGKLTSKLPEGTAVTAQLIRSGKTVDSTSVSGGYTFYDVDDGVYTLRVSGDKLVTRDYTVSISGEITLDIDVHLTGDINGDGQVSPLDVALVNNHLKHKKLLTGYQYLCADVTGTDGKISPLDAARINNAVKGVKPF